MKKKPAELSHKDKILLAKIFFESCPFATKVYMAMKTGLDMEFIKANWKEITGMEDVNNFILK